jgi:pyruvate kinase
MKNNPQDIALRWRRTKIIATIGPASDSPRAIAALLDAGADLFRLNMSHGDHAGHRAAAARIRAAARKAGRHVAIVVDLCGPKIRVGRFEGGAVELRAGAAVTVTTEDVRGGPGLIPSQYARLARDVGRGERILLDDGNLELRVEAVKGSEVRCRVIEGGVLRDHKGMNLPDSRVSAPALTARDRRDVALAVELGADFVALSFVRGAGDVRRLRRLLERLGAPIPVIAKIERPEAVAAIDAILAEAYAIMIARGDLGVELPAERLPIIQRDLIARARRRYTPVIVATQMLESMITQARPTRAEVTDVAGAAFLSADAVMLSGETAVGRHPVQVVATMDRILREVERELWAAGRFAEERPGTERNSEAALRDAVAHAALGLAHDLGLQAIIVPTRTGTTARVVAAHRTVAPTVGACAIEAICRRMALHWGVVAVHVEDSDTRDWRRLCALVSQKCELGRRGHSVLVISGFHEKPAQSEPVMKILRV